MPFIEARVTGLDTMIGRFEGLDAAVHARLREAVDAETAEVASAASVRLGELFKNPVRMQQSLSTEVDDSGSVITGTAQASGLPYLAIHEYGGTTRPHDIYPVHASVLAFPMPGATGFRTGGAAGDMVFTKHVSHPGSVMPERSYMRYGLAQRRESIRAAFLAAATDSAQQSNP